MTERAHPEPRSIDPARWSVRITADGSRTLVDPHLGQACHSLAGAWTQARERYALGARVRARALELVRGGRTTLRLLDIGTGLGFNLSAALEALEGTGIALDALTLERDAEVWRTTLALGAHGATPDGLERAHAPLRAAFERALHDPTEAARGITVDAPLTHEDPVLASTNTNVTQLEHRVRFVVGDAHAALERLDSDARFDAVFLDPFSPAVDPASWSHAFLASIARHMASQSTLATYSVALAVRVALCAAGLAIGAGAHVGTKGSGTLASPDRAFDPLPPRLARRIARRAQQLVASEREEPWK